MFGTAGCDFSLLGLLSIIFRGGKKARRDAQFRNFRVHFYYVTFCIIVCWRPTLIEGTFGVVFVCGY
uniref:Uncharacterized protein n=1 Tax=Romanomermis culicivorax TaxID=13658 RepID=A0A915KND5_ROMCU